MKVNTIVLVMFLVLIPFKINASSNKAISCVQKIIHDNRIPKLNKNKIQMSKIDSPDHGFNFSSLITLKKPWFIGRKTLYLETSKTKLDKTGKTLSGNQLCSVENRPCMVNICNIKPTWTTNEFIGGGTKHSLEIWKFKFKNKNNIFFFKIDNSNKTNNHLHKVGKTNKHMGIIHSGEGG